MLTKNYAKLINSLSNKKFRQKYNLFIVEGIKSVSEVLNSGYSVEKLFYTSGNWSQEFKNAIKITEKDLQQISSLKTANQVIALVKILENLSFKPSEGLTIVLDDIRDPGNLGTIIRLADWFGIKQILCSKESVDVYNPKCIQASMGSFLRVNVCYENLYEVLQNSNHTIFGTFMNGNNIYKQQLPNNGFIIFGNEANGISKKIEELCDEKLSIPQFGNSTESLNVAMATAICLGEWKSQMFKLNN